ncbi:hypothetical protein MKX03_008713 [Papaver bracteatum]|nr:hypothetical protein MKX03_008713 [Papaver bracteatum]
MAVPQSISGNEAACNGFVPLSPKTALVVDDSEAVRMIHSLHLRAIGFQTREVENGQEAVRLLESGMRFDATKRIRDMGIQCGILGVSADEDIQTNFVQSGLTEFFCKPLTSRMLILPIQHPFRSRWSLAIYQDIVGYFQ